MEINDLKKQSSQIFEQDTRFIMLCAETERLHRIISDRVVEADLLKNQYNALQKLHAEDLESLKNEYEDRFKNTINLEVKDLHSKYQTDKSTFDVSVKNISNKAADFEKKFGMLTEDHTRLQNIYNEKVREIEAWQVKYQSLERAYQEDIDILRQEHESQKKATVVN